MTAATKAMQSVGSSMFVSAVLPTTYDAAGYATGPVWKEIGELDNVPAYGPKSDVQTRTPLKSGITDKLKGARNMGSMSLELAWAPGDVGQAALIAAEAQSGPVAFKVSYPDGTLEYFTGLAVSYERGPGASGDFVKATCMIEIKTAIVTVYAP